MTAPLLCVCCSVLRSKKDTRPPNLPKNPPVCDWCRDRTLTNLTAIPAAYAAIDAEPVRGVTEIRSRMYESKPPLNISALSLLGAGTETPCAILDFWALDWADMLSQAPPTPYVFGLAEWLTARFGWACANHPAIDEFAADIRSLAGQLHAFRATDRGEPVGRCPRLMGEDRCNTRLYVDPYADHIQCTRCKQTWRRREGEWMHLRAQQIAAGVEAA